jgi:hypothetical protein
LAEITPPFLVGSRPAIAAIWVLDRAQSFRVTRYCIKGEPAAILAIGFVSFFFGAPSFDHEVHRVFVSGQVLPFWQLKLRFVFLLLRFL